MGSLTASAGTDETIDASGPIASPAPNAPSDAVLPPGTRIGDYVIGEPIGSGTFGTVYAAEHPVIQTPAAVKVLAWRYSADAQMVARFIDEARAVNRIQHPSIVRIFNFGRLPDMRRYHVMERLFGEGLDTRLQREERLSMDAALTILRPIAAALAAAHAAGVIHRDVKPANVFVSDNGPAKLLDFGVAKLVDDAAHARQTATGVAVGTPAFMAPEQCLGEKIGPTVDIYALGVMAFCMLSGKLPFERESGFAMMAAHLSDPPPELHQLVPEYPPGVSAVLLEMMAKSPADRPQDSIAAIEALARAVHAPAPPPPPARRRSGALIAAAALIVGAVIALLAWPDGAVRTDAGAGPMAVARPLDMYPASVATQPADAQAPAVVARPDAGRPDAGLVDAGEAMVEVEITGLPRGASARFGDRAFTFDTQSTLRLPRADTPAQVIFSAPGHRDRVVRIKRDAGHTQAVRLRPRKAAPRTVPSKGRKNQHGIDPW